MTSVANMNEMICELKLITQVFYKPYIGCLVGLQLWLVISTSRFHPPGSCLYFFSSTPLEKKKECLQNYFPRVIPESNIFWHSIWHTNRLSILHVRRKFRSQTSDRGGKSQRREERRSEEKKRRTTAPKRRCNANTQPLNQLPLYCQPMPSCYSTSMFFLETRLTSSLQLGCTVAG